MAAAVLALCAVLPGVAAAKTAGVDERRVAWILFSTVGAKPVSHDRLKDVFQAGVNVKEGIPDFSVQAWFDTVSGGRVHMVSDIEDEASRTDDVFGWYTVPPLENDPCGDVDAAVHAAQRDGFREDDYEHIIFLWDHRDECPGAGTASAAVGGKKVYDGISAGEIEKFGAVRPDMLIHELGHNLGLTHALGLRCQENGLTVTFSTDDNCDSVQFGENFDAMSQYMNYRHINAFFQVRLGWLPQAAVVDASESRTYRIGAFEARGSLPAALRVRVPGSEYDPTFFYVEFRTERDYDRNVPADVCAGDNPLRRRLGTEPDPAWEGATAVCNSPVTNAGVLIRYALGFDYEYQGYLKKGSPQTWLLDATPETTFTEDPAFGFDVRDGFEDPALPVGRTFTHQDVSITLDSVEPDPADPDGPPIAANITVRRSASST